MSRGREIWPYGDRANVEPSRSKKLGHHCVPTNVVFGFTFVPCCLIQYLLHFRVLGSGFWGKTSLSKRGSPDKVRRADKI